MSVCVVWLREEHILRGSVYPPVDWFYSVLDAKQSQSSKVSWASLDRGDREGATSPTCRQTPAAPWWLNTSPVTGIRVCTCMCGVCSDGAERLCWPRMHNIRVEVCSRKEGPVHSGNVWGLWVVPDTRVMAHSNTREPPPAFHPNLKFNQELVFFAYW